MTTIIYDPKTAMMYADSRAYNGTHRPIRSKSKLHRLKDGSIIGISTNCTGGDQLLLDWLAADCPASSKPDFKKDTLIALVVRPSGEIYYITENLAMTGPICAPYYVIGSGAEYAIGAMAVGASAKAAVAAAIENDIWSGGKIMSLPLERPNTDQHKTEVGEAGAAA